MLMHLHLEKMGQPFFRQFLSFIDFLNANRRFTSDYLDTTIMTKETQDKNGMKTNLFVDKLVNVTHVHTYLRHFIQMACTTAK